MRSGLRTSQPRRACLGTIPEVRARQIRRLLRRQGRELIGPTVVAVEVMGMRQNVELVPDADRWIGARWTIRAPCCGRRRLAVFVDRARRRLVCWQCGNVRSPRDLYARNTVFRAMLPLLDVQRLRRRLAHWYASRANRARYASLERHAVAQVQGNLQRLVKSAGTGGSVVDPPSAGTNRGKKENEHE